MHGVFNAALSCSSSCLAVIIAKSMAMKKALAKAAAKAKKLKVKARAKATALPVQEADDDAKAIAAATKKNTKGKVKGKAAAAKAIEVKVKVKGNAAAAKAMIVKAKVKGKAAAKAMQVKAKVKGKAAASMKKPASWNAWAEQEDEEEEEEEEDEEEEEEEDEEDVGKDVNPPTKAQCKVFEDALQRAPGTRGSLPAEIHEMWRNMARGPGSAQERHALRNAIVPKDASYGHVCTIDSNGPLMNRVKAMFEIKQHTVQLKGVSESECLWKTFQGNADAMQKSHRERRPQGRQGHVLLAQGHT